MRPDIHAAALRSAAKLVLGMASIATINTGCSSEPAEETAVGSDAVVTAETKKTAEDCDAGTTATPDPKGCGAILAAAFPDPAIYAWEPHAESAEVVACCREGLASFGDLSSTPAFAAPRWECCTAFDKAEQKDPNTEWPVTVAHGVPGFACTPWGPPVPPSMARKTRRSPARRDMVTFLAAAVA